MLAVICVWFILLKRPVYESVFVSFILLVAITNKWSSVLEYINEGMGTSLLYSMVVFVAMSILLDKTNVDKLHKLHLKKGYKSQYILSQYPQHV